MPPENRQSLVSAFSKHLPEPSSPVVLVARPDQPRPTTVRPQTARQPASRQVYEPSIAFILEISTLLASRDHASITLLGEGVADALQGVVRDSENVHSILLSRTVFLLFHLMNASQDVKDKPVLRAPVVLHTVSGFDQSRLEDTSDSVLKGLAFCLQRRTHLRNELINTPDFWLILGNLHGYQEAAPAVFGLVETIVNSEPMAVTADNYMAITSLLDNFATAGSIGASAEQQNSKRRPAQTRENQLQRVPSATIKAREALDKEIVLRGYQAVVLISQLIQRVPHLIKQSHLDREEAWMTYWSPVFQRLQTQCLNPCRKIRRQACSSLQNALLSPDLSPSTDEQWALIFRTVLFGLISRLLKPEVHQTDPTGMNETRLQAANLLCRTFLHHLPSLAQREDLLELWLHILDIMDRLMNSGQEDNLAEAVPEGLKNIILVMAGSDVLTPPQPGERPSQLWVETVKRVDRFVPDLMEDLFPQTKPQPQAPDDVDAKQDENKAPSSEEQQRKTSGEKEPRPSQAAEREVDPQPQPAGE